MINFGVRAPAGASVLGLALNRPKVGFAERGRGGVSGNVVY